MLIRCLQFTCFVVLLFNFSFVQWCSGQFVKSNSYEISTTPLPFPACKVDNIDCLRRGIRTFFFLMDSGHLGMKAIDPAVLNSVSVSLPEEQLSFLLRRIIVTGGRWTKLAQKKFNLPSSKSTIIFKSDLHVTGEISMRLAGRLEPYIAFITMDIQDVESNITYTWNSKRGIDKEDYILIGPERIAVRNSRIPTFFLQPNSDDSRTIEKTLQLKQSILDHLSNEVVQALMHFVVDNFRLFANKVPVKHYYKYEYRN